MDACAAASTGCQSPLESSYLRQVERAHGLPHGVRQRRVTIGSRRSYDDVRYETCGVIVELDGEQHVAPVARAQDAARDNSRVASGMLVLRYGWAAVAFSPCRVAAEVAYVLRNLGWQGQPRACPRCTS